MQPARNAYTHLAHVTDFAGFDRTICAALDLDTVPKPILDRQAANRDVRGVSQRDQRRVQGEIVTREAAMSEGGQK